jgi:hypothetical protein
MHDLGLGRELVESNVKDLTLMGRSAFRHPL